MLCPACESPVWLQLARALGLTILSDTAPSELVARLRYLKPSTGFRQHWQYNNLGYVTLGEIVSRLSGTSFVEYVTERIFKPIGLDNTSYSTQLPEADDHVADGHIARGQNLTACAEQWSEGLDPDEKCLGKMEVLGWRVPEGLSHLNPLGGIYMPARDMVSTSSRCLVDKCANTT